jgi:glycosyltransferase involved in cell wall biosynthesis
MSDGRYVSPSAAFVLKGYPRLSETFIAQEILALERRGLDILIVSLRQPTDTKRHPVHDEITADVLYLPEFPLREVPRVLRSWRRVRALPGYRDARSQWLKDLRRGFTLARVRSFFQAIVLAGEARERLERFHAHYIHTPASVTRYAAMIRGLPWSCSAHARDIWTTADWEKADKLESLDWLVTCTRHGAQHLASLAREPQKVELVYHGLDFSRFPVPANFGCRAHGGDRSDPVAILSVGRAVEKKGYGTLLAALARLPENLHWRFVHIGYGPLLAELQEQAARLGISDRVEWRGAQPQDKVIEAYRAAALFVLANCVARDGDMDGLPNAMMEAQSQGVACISTSVSAIPELIEDGVTGLLVPPDEEGPLAAAIGTLITDPALRARLASKGAERVRARFSHEQGIGVLARKFGISSAPARLRA